uniref:Uncharacterized protein n=1 Tax=Triticum urartu TaxID=4572 RepID=A0A8R7U236_TRIUA
MSSSSTSSTKILSRHQAALWRGEEAMFLCQAGVRPRQCGATVDMFTNTIDKEAYNRHHRSTCTHPLRPSTRNSI